MKTKHFNFILQILGWLLLLMLIISPVIVSAKSIYGSGKSVTIRKDIEKFDGIEISNSFSVRINYSKDYSVTIQIEDNVKEYLVVEKVGGILKIGLEQGRTYYNVHPQAVVTLPDIKKLGLSGASTGIINGFEFGHDFKLNLSGASKVYGCIKTGDLNMDLSGASKVNLTGRGKDMIIQASGSSDITMDKFSVADAYLGLSGASRCLVNINGELDVQASGSSKIRYCGSGSLGNIETSGSSKVKRM